MGMKKSNLLSYLLILFGAVIAIYAKAGTSQNVILLIVGILVLMFGAYKLSSTIPSVTSKEAHSFIEEEE